MSGSEVWKDVVEYEGLYKASDRGNIYSIERISSQGRKIGGMILKQGYNSGGYPLVSLCKNGKVKSKYIHRLVLEAFVENPNNLPEVNHKDENKTNNHVENLEWCTREYNNNHGTRNERVAQAQSRKVRAVNIKTGEAIRFKSTSEAGSKGYTQGCVADACRGDYYGGNLYRGYQWSYEKEVE